MNGAARSGRRARLRPGRAGAERAGVPCRLGAARLRADARHGRDRRVDTSTCRAMRASASRRREYLGVRLLRESGSPGCERLLVERGLVSKEELDAGQRFSPGLRCRASRRPPTVPRCSPRARSTERPAPAAAKFAPGDRVRAKVMHPTGHTRLPRYVRGRTGRIATATARMSFPMRAPPGRARSRAGSIPSPSSRRSSGDRTGAPATKSFSISSSLILNRPDSSRSPAPRQFRCTATVRSFQLRGRRAPSRSRSRSTSAACSPGRNGRKCSVRSSRKPRRGQRRRSLLARVACGAGRDARTEGDRQRTAPRGATGGLARRGRGDAAR